MAEIDFAIGVRNDGAGNYVSYAIASPAVRASGGTRLSTEPYINNATLTEAPLTITNATNATPIVVTSASHGYSNGDIVFIQGVLGNTAANGGPYQIANVATNTFELVDSVGNAAWTSGGKVQRLARVKNIYDAMMAAVVAVQSYKAAGN